MSEYAERDIIGLDKNGGYFFRHMNALTAENLRGKAEISAELAYRDSKVSDQQRRIDALEKALLDAIESYEEYSQYAGEYLCKKHRVAEHIQELRELLATDDSREEIKPSIKSARKLGETE